MIKLLYIIFIIFVTVSCSLKPIDNYHGVAFLEKKQEKLLINKSNKNDIIKILGSPSTKSILEDDLWIYLENRKTRSSIFKLGKDIELTNNVLVLQIDKKGLLKKKNFLILMIKIKLNSPMNKQKCLIKMDSFMVLYQVLDKKLKVQKKNDLIKNRSFFKFYLLTSYYS